MFPIVCGSPFMPWVNKLTVLKKLGVFLGSLLKGDDTFLFILRQKLKGAGDSRVDSPTVNDQGSIHAKRINQLHKCGGAMLAS